jgi:hypothetical protein
MNEDDPNEAINCAGDQYPAEDCKCYGALGRGPNLVSVLQMLVGVHQIAVDIGRGVRWIHRRLLGLELCHPRLKLRVLVQKRFVAGCVHVGAMLIRPHGPVVQRLIKQPPPEQTAVRISITNDGPQVICLKYVLHANTSRGKRRRVRNIIRAAISAGGSGSRHHRRRSRRIVPDGRRLLRFIVMFERILAGLFLARELVELELRFESDENELAPEL